LLTRVLNENFDLNYLLLCFRLLALWYT